MGPSPNEHQGPASETLSRSFLQFLHETTAADGSGKSLLNTTVWSSLSSGYNGLPLGTTPLDSIQIGMSRTRSSNSLVTDSAAGATAFSSSIKTYNGAIAVEPVSKTPVGTVLEAAKSQGYATGLVATSRITHATPAAFYSHVVDRNEIAQFLVGNGPRGQVVDIALGGGLCFFLPNSTERSCRTDGSDLLADAETRGYTVLKGMKALEEWHADKGHEQSAPVLGFFADDHMDYEIDRQQITVLADEQPSLKEMAKHALDHLQNQNDKGFFLMVEGSRIDMAGHNNDPTGHISDILAYHTTIAFLKNWVDEANANGSPTMLISVSDHETGGLSLARQLGTKYPEYLWYPDALANATHSTSWLGEKIAHYPDVTRQWLKDEIYEKGLGITDVSEAEIDHLWPQRTNGYRANRILADAISRRAQLGWSTAGHSGVDVNLYAYGINATGLVGNHENTEIGHHIAHAMGLDLDAVTLGLNK
ncbi:alkaline phosphatase-like protein [Meredithblackwellia eburnea MCA 4105]